MATIVRANTVSPSASIVNKSFTTHQSRSALPFSYRPSHEAYRVERTTMTHETNSCRRKKILAINLYWPAMCQAMSYLQQVRQQYTLNHLVKFGEGPPQFVAVSKTAACLWGQLNRLDARQKRPLWPVRPCRGDHFSYLPRFSNVRSSIN